MKMYLITDTHFNHKKVIEYCGRPENYEQLLFSSMNNVPEDSVLIHLGDVCIGKDNEMHEKYIKPLKCKKWLIRGNHDRKSDSWYYERGWDMVCDQLMLKRFGKRVLFSHMPQPRLAVPSINPSVMGIPLFDINIHGHFHNTSHRSVEPELQRIYSKEHKLLAVEYTKYQVVDAEKFIIGD